ncbi:DUF2493 domain-containing protein [Novosphingobium malaysiense]|uniref:YspA cpYpsA-related SLOG domain-containing protein n=1 Tax=Novosphingobium malaysiense TaxID=1348853 RepID=A0A0B1ZM12_9SPHN|nr:DUF2493 domain-containing protein [Novosphingobium malaysiense]KHK90379.1 hypothetical protein LK12_17460 [Novosphingobium malaysiense]
MNTKRTIRDFSEIADLIAAETLTPADGFSTAFETGLDESRMGVAEEELTCDMPDAMQAQLATEMLVATLFDVLRDTRIESLAPRLAWGIVNSFHKVAEQLDGEADRAAMKVRDLARDADGSEVLMGELEEAQVLCQSLDEAREAVACMRDHAAATYLAESGRPWCSPRGSLVSSKRTASVIAAQDFLAARRMRKAEAHAPQGPVVIFSGGQSWEDHELLTNALDAVKARVPNMVLATTAQDKGCDAIAAAWAARSGTMLIAFTLDRRLGKRAGFARNEQLLGLCPVEAIVCEGSGLQSHLAREVRAKRVPARFFALKDQRTNQAAA